MWAAENIAPSLQEISAADQRQRSSETPEAALARLTLNYSNAMSLVHALHTFSKSKAQTFTRETISGYDADREDKILAYSDEEEPEMQFMEHELLQIAEKARHAFDTLILSDPLVQSYLPHLVPLLSYLDVGSARKESPMFFTSSAHIQSLKQLAYAVLVNYADLLLIGIQYDPSDVQDPTDILDRGVVQPLSILNHFYNLSTCWNTYEKKVDQTIRLALVAYCDAAELDASDPSLWLKLACVARRLGRRSTSSIQIYNYAMDNLKRQSKIPWHHLCHGRLECYALEMGMNAIKEGLPPNRTLSKALEQMYFYRHDMDLDYDYSLPSSTTQNGNLNSSEVRIDLLKNSWTALGKCLLHLCKDPSSVYPGVSFHKSWNATCGQKDDFSSPMIRLQISPLLSIPEGTLIKICDFLGYDDIGKPSRDLAILQSSSRILSESITSAKAFVEKDKLKRMKRIEHEMRHLLIESESERNKENELDMKNKMLSQRTSARVKSNLMTSNKNVERSANRVNVEYCLVSALLPFTIYHPLYSKIVKSNFEWSELSCLARISSICTSSVSQMHNHEPEDEPNDVPARALQQNIHSFENHSASPIFFMNKWSGANSGATDLLIRYINHVAYNVEDVYAMETGKASAFTKCIVDCFSYMAQDCSMKNELLPCWFGPETCEESGSDCIQTLATNLLFVELKMREAELKNLTCDSYTDDIHIVRTSLPMLLRLSELVMETKDFSVEQSALRDKLRIRVLFLAATFFIWCSRSTEQGKDIKALEKSALDSLEEIIRIFQIRSRRGSFKLKIKHLISPWRSGDIWSELTLDTILKHRGEFQFRTVLSRVREQFSNVLNSLKKDGFDSFLISNNASLRDKLHSIQTELTNRYSLADGLSCSNFEELVDDFLSLHFSDVMNWHAIYSNESTEDEHTMFDFLLPSSKDIAIPLETLSSPSILSILLICYHQLAENYGIELTNVLSRLIIICIQKMESLVKESAMIHLISSSLDDSDSDNFTDGSELSKRRHPRSYIRLANLLIYIVEKAVTSNDGEAIVSNVSDYLMRIIYSAFHSSISDFSFSGSLTLLSHHPDVECLQTVVRLAQRVTSKVEASLVRMHTSMIFTLLSKCVVKIRSKFVKLLSKDISFSRTDCLRLVSSYSKVLSFAMTETVHLLTRYPYEYAEGGVLVESFLISSLITSHPNQDTVTPFVQLIESLAWFWEFSKSGLSSDSQYSTLTNTFHKNIAKTILLPCSAVIISLLNASGHGSMSHISESFRSLAEIDQHAFENPSDYFDSDDSVLRWTKDDSESEVFQSNKLLQSLKKSVQCIGVIYSECCIHDDLLDFSPDLPSKSNNYLSLLVAQTLSRISELVLKSYSNENDSLGIWATEYPFGFQSSGMQLDLLLHKAYHRLFGIQISAPHFNAAIPNDAIVPTSSSDHRATSTNALSMENIFQIYRCIRRAYSNGRRTVPSELLDLISSNLPPLLCESENVKAIKSYLFTDYDEGALLHDQELLLEENDTFESIIPQAFSSYIIRNINLETKFDFQVLEEEHDINFVRKDIWESIAEKASLNTSQTITVDNNLDLSNQMQERTITSPKIEKSVDDQIYATIHILQYEPENAYKWLRLASTISLKLNHICDRILPAEASYDPNKFCLNSFKSCSERDIQSQQMRGHPKPLSQLLILQKAVYEKATRACTELRDVDFFLFVQHQWSNPDSLRKLECKLLDSVEGRDRSILLRMKRFYDESNFSKWQYEWGLQFIRALRKIHKRCYSASICLASKRRNESEDDNRFIDIAESYATSCYDEIGFNGSPITSFEKRQRAIRSKLLFEAVLDSQLSAADKIKNGEIMPTWETRFMIGKCYEKIANTLDQEAYGTDDGTSSKRRYELVMTKSLESYIVAYREAKQFKDNGNVLDSQGGGSSNGLVEYLYRLHATRWKILLSAIKKPQRERRTSLMEATRLLENFWCDINHDTIFDDTKLMDRVWIIFCDIVNALASCRTMQPFFHRSSFRHAQALMWAPFIHDPDGCPGGSQDSVPSFKRHRILELRNYSDSMNAAKSVISALFDKKRPQLCAVWVTTPSKPNPFERINDSIRKYDRLRCKYIGAYLECLGICKDYDQIDLFLSWVKSSKRDFPSFYHVTSDVHVVRMFHKSRKSDSHVDATTTSSSQVSASTDSIIPNSSTTSMRCDYSQVLEAPPHHKECLLEKGFGLIFFIKKYANAIMSNIVMNLLKVDRCGSSVRDCPQNDDELVDSINDNGKSGTPNIGDTVSTTTTAITSTITNPDQLIQEEKTSKQEEGTEEEEKEDIFRKAYKCFLRLNCPIQSNLWKTLRVQTMISSGQIPEVNVLLSAYEFTMKEKRRESSSLSSLHHDNKEESSDVTAQVDENSDIMNQLVKAVMKACHRYPDLVLERTTTEGAKKIRRKRKSNDMS